MCGGGGDGGAAQMAADEAARKAEVAARIKDINGIFDANASSGIYGDAKSAVLELDRNYLDKERMDTERMNRFSLARQGLAGGSQEVDRNKALLDVYNQGVLQSGQRAGKLEADWKSADEDLRNSLIRQVTADPQALNAEATRSQLNAAADSRKNSGIDTSLGDLFTQFDNSYSLNRYSQGLQQGMGTTAAAGGGLPNVSSPRQSYQGR